MAYVITASCIGDYSCWEICPVDCIGPGPSDSGFETCDQLYIDPEACIDCAACVDVCPVSAIAEEASLSAGLQPYAMINRAYFADLRAPSLR